VWDVPTASTSSGFLKTVLNGWQISGIFQFETGGPYTVLSGRDNSLDGLANDRAKFTGVSVDPPAGSDKTVVFNPAAFAVNDIGTFGDVGKGAFYGPSFHNWDVGLVKNTRLNGRLNLQFRAEAFNVFNHANFEFPKSGDTTGRNVSGGGFGRISSARDPRIIQFGVKLEF
jgi:hypothetical protein